MIISPGSGSVICCWEKRSLSLSEVLNGPPPPDSKGGPIVFLTSGNLHFVGVVFVQVEELQIPSLGFLISLQMPRLSFINHIENS